MIKLVIVCFHPQHGSNVLLWPFLLEVTGCRQDKRAFYDFLSKPNLKCFQSIARVKQNKMATTNMSLDPEY